MKTVRRESLTRRTLVRITVAAGLALLIATGVTYTIVYDAMETLRLDALRDYVEQRARREEARYVTAESDLLVMRDVFLQHWREPPAPDDATWFDANLARTPDGAVRSRRELVDASRQASTWIRAGAPVTAEVKRLVRLSSELCEQFFVAWREQLPTLYVSSPFQFNTGIAPKQPEWVWEVAADFDQDAHEWEGLVTVAADPERGPRWTGLLLDVAAPGAVERVAFATLCVPVDVDGRHVLTLHDDVYFEELLDSVLRPEREGVTHVVFRDDGRLIAHHDLWQELVASDGKLSLLEQGTPELRSIFTAVTSAGGDVGSGYDANSGLYYAARRLRGPQWFFVSLLPKAQVRAEAFRSAQWVLWIGLGAVAFVVGTLALILRREIAQPLGALLTATRRVASGDARTELAVTRPDELGELAASFNDMTRRMAERDAALRASERRWRMLFEQSPLSVQVFSPEGRSLRVNAGFEKLWGVPGAVIAGYCILDDAQLAATGALDIIRRAFAGAVVFVPEAPYDTAKNPEVANSTPRQLWVQAVLYPVLDDAGQVEEVVCIHEDVTVRKHVEDELRALNQSLEQRIHARTVELSESEARLRTLLDRSPIAIVTLDADTGRYVDGNEHALQLLGVDHATLLASSPGRLSPERQPGGRASVEVARQNINEALAGGAPVFEWVLFGSGGREIPCEVHLARLPASGRNLCVGILLDVTTRKRAEAELLRALARERELGQLKGEFVSMVSHEFRTPLEVIQSSSDLLSRYHERLDPAKRQEQLDAIHRSVRHMAEMMESVLILSRVEAGTVSFQPEPVDIVAWSRRLVDEIASATSHVCPIDVESHVGPGRVAADVALLRHIFGNLLSNAVKYSPPGTTVHFRIVRENDELEFQVVDRGRGIPLEDQAGLFRSFHRGRNVGQVAGTGLGLVIVKRCVELHRGRIHCESREGAGTTFFVTLPWLDPAANFSREDDGPVTDAAPSI